MENDIPPVNRIDQIREELKALEGQRVKVRAPWFTCTRPSS